jgi:hypothetical protein
MLGGLMKNVFLFLIMISALSSHVFGQGQTNTDCDSMREENFRHNPKANVDEINKLKSKKDKSSEQ